MEQAKKPRMSLSDALAQNVGIPPVQSSSAATTSKQPVLNQPSTNCYGNFISSSIPTLSSLRFGSNSTNFSKSYAMGTGTNSYPMPSSNFAAFPFPTIFNNPSDNNNFASTSANTTEFNIPSLNTGIFSSAATQQTFGAGNSSSLAIESLCELSKKVIVFYKKMDIRGDEVVKNCGRDWIMKKFNLPNEALIEISDVVNIENFRIVYFLFDDSKTVDNIISMHQSNMESSANKQQFYFLEKATFALIEGARLFTSFPHGFKGGLEESIKILSSKSSTTSQTSSNFDRIILSSSKQFSKRTTKVSGCSACGSKIHQLEECQHRVAVCRACKKVGHISHKCPKRSLQIITSISSCSSSRKVLLPKRRVRQELRNQKRKSQKLSRSSGIPEDLLNFAAMVGMSADATTTTQSAMDMSITNCTSINNNEWMTSDNFNSTTAGILRNIQACTSIADSNYVSDGGEADNHNNKQPQSSYFAYNGLTDS